MSTNGFHVFNKFVFVISLSARSTDITIRCLLYQQDIELYTCIYAVIRSYVL